MRRARRLRVGVGLVVGWRHGGVDWLAVARAAARDLERGRVLEGGSTITQQ
jgi:membrane carboxypeptidase/penicillin-binding protein